MGILRPGKYLTFSCFSLKMSTSDRPSLAPQSEHQTWMRCSGTDTVSSKTHIGTLDSKRSGCAVTLLPTMRATACSTRVSWNARHGKYADLQIPCKRSQSLTSQAEEPAHQLPEPVVTASAQCNAKGRSWKPRQ